MDTTRLAVQSFQQSLVVALRSDEGSIVSVPSELGYDSANPYALTVSFHLDHGPVVVWTFARDLLSGGLTEPTGDGDVHVWPCLDNEGLAVLCVELCTPHGDALVELRTTDAVRFVDASHALVAPGEESPHVDVEAMVEAILAAAHD
jgi:hypothetical protein